MFVFTLLLYSFCVTQGSSLNFQEAGVPSQFYIDDGYFEAYGDNKGGPDPDISSSAVRREVKLKTCLSDFLLSGFHGVRAIF